MNKLNEHTHQCRNCKPSAYPQGERAGDNHIAVRFGYPDVMCKVFLNGVDVSNDATEAIAGNEGHVWMLSKDTPSSTRFHVCGCCQGVCEYERMGKVEILR